MLDESFRNGSNGGHSLKFNIVRHLRTAASNIYSATDAAHYMCYNIQYHHKIVLHMY